MTDVIQNIYVTEKAMDEMDFDNKLQFIVHMDATKPEIRDAVSERYDVDVESVNTQITMNGTKKATVSLAGEDEAQDIASRMGVF